MDNVVELAGRLSTTPEVRALPSGDEIVLLRVMVVRPDGSRSDSVRVVVGPAPAKGTRRAPGEATATAVRRAAALARGDTVRVSGWLRRRFWDAAGQPRTVVEVVASAIEAT